MKKNRSKTRRLTLLFLAGMLIFSSSCAQAPKGEPEKGKRWFGLHRCSGCHGENGIGGLAPTIAGTDLSYKQVLKQIRTGSTVMPAFKVEVLSDQDVADIYLYLKSLPK